MEMLEDVLLEKDVMEIPCKKYRTVEILGIRLREDMQLLDDFLKDKEELIGKRKGSNLFMHDGYMTIEESRYLYHKMVDDVRKSL